LSETNLNNRTASHIYKNNKNYSSFWSCSEDKPIGSGVGIIIHNKLAKYIQKSTEFKGRAIFIDLFLQGNVKIRIIQIYNYANLKELENTNFTDAYEICHEQKIPTYKNHNMIITYFSTDGILKYQQEAKAKRYQTKRRIFKYDNMSKEKWKDFANYSNELFKKSFLYKENAKIINQITLDKTWNKIKEIILQAAEKHIPYKWTTNIKSNQKDKSPALKQHYFHLKSISKILLRLGKRKISSKGFPNNIEWNEMKTNLESISNNIKYPLEEIDININVNNISKIKKITFKIYNTLSTICKIKEKQVKQEQINLLINKRCENYKDDQSTMIDSILERNHKRIILDRVLFKENNNLILTTDPEKIKAITNQHFQNVARGKNEIKQINNYWKNQYLPKEEINSDIYKNVMDPPTYKEWKQVITTLPNNKATGPSKISNEMIKHLGKNFGRCLWKLISACFEMNEIPNQWRIATIYPIPKPMDWECFLDKTRPITLLETVRKAMVKILNKRLSEILAKNNILKGDNFAGLPGGSTFEPIRALNSIIEESNEYKKEIWILFQDLSKAYDCVNIRMLEKAMQRLKFPQKCINLIINLFTKRKNKVITCHGETDPYEVLVGIDQGEVISPLLWCIYYDPLLCEIKKQKNIGYKMEVNWKADISKPEIAKISAEISTLAYMDDTTWITTSKENLEKILEIADDFYNLNNIQINKNKSASNFMAIFRKFFKNKLHINSKAPNVIMQCNNIYNVIDLYDLQQRCQLNNLNIQINDKHTLGKITDIRLKQLQIKLWLPISPLLINDAPFNKIKCNIIAATLSLIKDTPLQFSPYNKNEIKGGYFPLIDILKETYYQHANKLKKYNLMFLDQLVSQDRNYLITRKDLAARYKIYRNSGKTDPKWFHKIQQLVLEDFSISRKLKPTFTLCSTKFIPLNLEPLDMDQNSKNWVAIWNNNLKDSILGRIVKKDSFNGKILVEHWIPYFPNININASPSVNRSLINKCQGCPCHVPIKRYEHTIIHLCNNWYNYKEAVIFNAKKIKLTESYETNVSIFEIKAKAKRLFYKIWFNNNSNSSNNIVNNDNIILSKIASHNINMIKKYTKDNMCSYKLIEH
ncbi:6194_t:CDS:2, partial [Entrophospora sp. SA101]